MKKCVQIQTPIGLLTGVGDADLLYGLYFLEEAPSLLIGWTPPLRALQQALNAYFAGTLSFPPLPLSLTGTPFQQQVWHALQQIPPGTTLSYGELASLIGRPNAHRAVGTAVGVNPFPLLIPCHRVIRSSGTLGGYRGGLERKETLLGHEMRHCLSACSA